MRRMARIAAWVVGIPLAGLILVTALLLFGSNTAPGRRLIERLAPRLTGGEIAIAGLGGRLPAEIRAARVEIRDGSGAWMRVDDLRIVWSPLALLSGTAKIETLTADHVSVLRLPGNRGPGLALRILVDRLRIGRLDLAPAIAGGPVALTLSGALRLASLEQGRVDLTARQRDGPGLYTLAGDIGPAGIRVRIAAAEPAHGPLAQLIRLPDLGPLSLTASVAGPRAAEGVNLAVAAGPLRATARGTIDLRQRTMRLDAFASAPAMAPRPDLSWRSARLEAHARGPFTAPAATGHLEIDGIAASGGTIGRLSADLRGQGGTLAVGASVTGLRLSRPEPELLATAPIMFRAEARLDDPRRPVTFSLSHPLFAIVGHTAARDGKVAGSLGMTVPALAPWAAMGGLDVEGHARFTADFSVAGKTARLKADGALSVTGGLPAAVRLLGDDVRLNLAAALDGSDVEVARAGIAGKALWAATSGSRKGGVLAFSWRFGISDLSRLDPNLAGALTAAGRLDGPETDLGLSAQAEGDIAGAGLAKFPVSLTLNARGLPGAPVARITAQARLAGAPLQLAAAGRRDRDGAWHVAIERARWQSGEGEGTLTLTPGATAPFGHVRLRMTRLDQLRPLLHQTVTGSLDAGLDMLGTKGRPQAALRIDIRRLAVGGVGMARAVIGGTIDDPLRRPRLALRLALDGIAAGGVAGMAQLTATGSVAALGLRLSSELHTAKGPARLSAAATADLARRDLAIAALRASFAGETARLLAPARVEFARGLAIERLRLGIGGAVLAVAGQVSPQLGLAVSLRNAGPALVAPFLPNLRAQGMLALEARLGGSLSHPGGTIRLTGRGLGLQSGEASAVPAVDLTARADLRGSAAQIMARLTAGGGARLRITGVAPLALQGPLDLRTDGTIDLAMANPILAANGRTLKGRVTLAVGIAGTLAAPRVTGSARLAHGDFQDVVLGVHIGDMTGTVTAEGDRLRIRQLTGRAGPGRLSLGGTIAVFAPGMPVDLVLTADKARPLMSDLLSAEIDGDVSVRGAMAERPTLGGEIRVRRADINIPDSLPHDVAVLDVRRPGQKAPPSAAGGPVLTLALTIDAPERVFVRGHGLDAELGGRLRLAGTSAAPVITGGFDLRQGNLSLAGQTLTFTSGRITFTDAGLTRKFDPSLDFVAQSTAGGITATLTVTGYADAPRITLTSTPPLPQDEVLSRLLFGQSVAQASPFQLAAIAGGLATLGGSGSGPLARLRNRLGLDQLSVGAASGTGAGAAVTAGKYVANRIYLGVKQGTTGGTQAQVQIDLTKRLKLQSTLGTRAATTVPATGLTPANDPGSSIGLTYQLEY